MGQFAAHDLKTLFKRQLIWIDVFLQRRLMHQAAHRKVRQPQPIKLLPHQVWRLAAKHHPCATQVGLHLFERRLNLPALVIHLCKLPRSCDFRIQQTCHQPVQWLGLGVQAHEAAYGAVGAPEDTLFVTVICACMQAPRVPDL